MKWKRFSVKRSLTKSFKEDIMSIAIITGASGGIGSEFARQLAGLGICDEFWFVARNEERMKKLVSSESPRDPQPCHCS